MGSSRLPGKVLVDLGGMRALHLLLARLQVDPTLRLVVATTDNPRDDVVAEAAGRANVAVFRGSEHDVLGRYAAALAEHRSDEVVRITGDCPLMDPQIVRDALELHRRAGADYTSNVHPRSYPKGLDVEVLSVGALRQADREAADPVEREHVTPFVVRHPRRFALAGIWCGQDLSSQRWTLDTADDAAHLRKIVEALSDPVSVPWREILRSTPCSRPAEAALILESEGPPPAGSAPWRKSFAVVRHGSRIGTVAAVVDDGGVTTIESDLEPPDVQAAAGALRDRLAADVQITRWHPT